MLIINDFIALAFIPTKFGILASTVNYFCILLNWL